MGLDTSAVLLLILVVAVGFGLVLLFALLGSLRHLGRLREEHRARQRLARRDEDLDVDDAGTPRRRREKAERGEDGDDA